MCIERGENLLYINTHDYCKMLNVCFILCVKCADSGVIIRLKKKSKVAFSKIYILKQFSFSTNS